MTLLFVYCLAIVLISLIGGWLPTVIALTHTRMQLIMSFVSGLMLGVALFHMLPHAISILGVDAAHTVANSVMAGLLGMFLLLRTFHFHQHDFSPAAPDHCQGGHDAGAFAHHSHSPTPEVAADPSLEPHPGVKVHRLSWTGVALGLALHTIIDGVALGAAVQADLAMDGHGGLLSLGVFVALLLHKPLDALSITSLMATAGWSQSAQRWINLGFALMCPLGAMLFVGGVSLYPQFQQHAVGIAMAFSAGVFLCISLSDLLPEVQFHSHDRRKLTVALLAGLLVAWLLLLLEH